MASSARTEQWIFWGGNPLSSVMTSLFVTFNASSMVLPMIILVATLDDVIAAAHPKVLNFASLIMPSSIRNVICMMSPQVALPTVPIAL